MAQHFRRSGHLPPAEELHAFLLHNDLKHLFSLAAFQLVLWEKEHTHAVFPLPADADAGFVTDPREEAVADLGQDAHSVSGSALGVLSGPVLQMLHDSQRVRHDLVALFPFYIDHGSDSTVVVFKSGTV